MTEPDDRIRRPPPNTPLGVLLGKLFDHQLDQVAIIVPPDDAANIHLAGIGQDDDVVSDGRIIRESDGSITKFTVIGGHWALLHTKGVIREIYLRTTAVYTHDGLITAIEQLTPPEDDEAHIAPEELPL